MKDPAVLDRINAMWDEHVAAAFPDDCRVEECDGIDLVMLDADIAGCVHAFVGSRGRLDGGRVRLLRDLHSNAEHVANALATAGARQYFVRLAELARMVRKECTG